MPEKLGKKAVAYMKMYGGKTYTYAEATHGIAETVEVDGVAYEKMKPGECPKPSTALLTIGGILYGKSMVAEALAKKTDEDMMALYKKTHPE